MKFRAIVIGASSGGMNALKKFFQALPAEFSAATIIVQHISANSDGEWIRIMNDSCEITIKEADEKEKIMPGTVYIAPPNYHLLIENDESFSLTIGEKVNFARPSIDLLFETAADVYGDALIGVILTGSNSDGAKGLKAVKQKGGYAFVEDPVTAESAGMPNAAIALAKPDRILPLRELISELINMIKNK